jgi:hypothetical protein
MGREDGIELGDGAITTSTRKPTAAHGDGVERGKAESGWQQ